jgi:hypothetical protein
MMRIYDVAQSERGTQLMKAILDAAYTRNAAPRPQAMTPSGRAQSVRAELLAAIRRARTAR